MIHLLHQALQLIQPPQQAPLPNHWAAQTSICHPYIQEAMEMEVILLSKEMSLS